jgi:hypothetical protein
MSSGKRTRTEGEVKVKVEKDLKIKKDVTGDVSKKLRAWQVHNLPRMQDLVSTVGLAVDYTEQSARAAVQSKAPGCDPILEEIDLSLPACYDVSLGAATVLGPDTASGTVGGGGHLFVVKKDENGLVPGVFVVICSGKADAVEQTPTYSASSDKGKLLSCKEVNMKEPFFAVVNGS